MIDFRAKILRELANNHVTVYLLCKRLEGEVSERSIRAYLSGKSDISAESLEKIVNAMGMRLVERAVTKKPQYYLHNLFKSQIKSRKESAADPSNKY